MGLSEITASLRNVTSLGPDGSGLRNFSMDISRGSIHALIGEADSGKDIVCRFLSGRGNVDKGDVLVDGKSPHEYGKALRHRVRIVDRQLTMIEQATVLEHFLFAKGDLLGIRRFNRRREAEEAESFLRENRVDIDPGRIIAELTAMDQYYLQMIIAAYLDPSLVVLQNSLQELNHGYKSSVMEIFKKLTAGGLSILIVTPLFDDVLDFSDTVTMIKSGECVLSSATSNLDRLTVLEAAYKQASREPASTPAETDIFRRHMQYYVSLLTDYPKPFVIVNTRLEIELANNAARTFFNVRDTPRRLLSEFLDEFFPGESQPMLERMEGKTHFSSSGLTMTVAGQTRVVNLSAYRVNEGGEDIGVVLTFDDVTEQTRLQEQMFLAEKVASLGILTAGMAHEINHPLSTINNIVEYMKVRFDDPEIQKEIGDIQEEVVNMTQIIKNLVDFTHSQAEERIDLHALIVNLVGLVRHYAGDRRINVTVRLCEADVFIRANKVEMRQVLLNLLSNAFSAVGKSGQVQISTRRDGDSVYLEVEDDGCGMSPDMLKNIFLPFYSTSSGKGMGLGLYIAYNIVTNLRGSISVDSLPGKGTRFSIKLDVC